MPASSPTFDETGSHEIHIAVRSRLRGLFYVRFHVGHPFHFDLLTTNRIANGFDTVRPAPADHYFLSDSRCLVDHGLFGGFGNFDRLVLPVDISGQLRIAHCSTGYYAVFFVQGDLLLYRLFGYEAANPGLAGRDLTFTHFDLLFRQAEHFFSQIASGSSGWRRRRRDGRAGPVEEIPRTMSVQNGH